MMEPEPSAPVWNLERRRNPTGERGEQAGGSRKFGRGLKEPGGGGGAKTSLATQLREVSDFKNWDGLTSERPHPRPDALAAALCLRLAAQLQGNICSLKSF